MRKFSIYDLRGEMGRNNNSKSLHNKKNDTNFIRFRFFSVFFVSRVDDEFILFVNKTRIPLYTDRQMNTEQKMYEYQHVSEL